MKKPGITKSQMIDPSQIITIRENGTVSCETVNTEPSLTQQQFADDADINKIMDRYQKTGEFKHVTSKTGVYGDFSEIKNYQEMLHTVIEADAAFNTLPAKLRSRFENDPSQLINYLQDPANTQEAISLGLINPQPSSPNDTNHKPNEPTPTPTTPVP